MSNRVFHKEYELKEYIDSLRNGIEKYKAEKWEIEQNIKSMSRRLKVEEEEMRRRNIQSAKKAVDAAQRSLDILDGKPVGPEPAKEILCGERDPSGYMPPCSYSRGHSGVCEGMYDSALVDRINREKELV